MGTKAEAAMNTHLETLAHCGDQEAERFALRWKGNDFAESLIDAWFEAGAEDWRYWKVLLDAYRPDDPTTKERAARGAQWAFRAGISRSSELLEIFTADPSLARNLEWYCLSGCRTPREWVALAKANVGASDVRALRAAAGPGYDGELIARLAAVGFSPGAIRSARSANRERLSPAPPAAPMPPLAAIGADEEPVPLELVDGWDLRIADQTANVRASTLAAFGGEVHARKVIEAWDRVVRSHPVDKGLLAALPSPLRLEAVIQTARLRAIEAILGGG